MDLKTAIAQVEALLLAEYKRRNPEDTRNWTCKLETWASRRKPPFGLRVAEVSFWYGTPCQPGSGGFSLMQDDVDFGAACYWAERAVIYRFPGVTSPDPKEQKADIADADARLIHFVFPKGD